MFSSEQRCRWTIGNGTRISTRRSRSRRYGSDIEVVVCVYLNNGINALSRILLIFVGVEDDRICVVRVPTSDTRPRRFYQGLKLEISRERTFCAPNIGCETFFLLLAEPLFSILAFLAGGGPRSLECVITLRWAVKLPLLSWRVLPRRPEYGLLPLGVC
jgi:hypothetical protein